MGTKAITMDDMRKHVTKRLSAGLMALICAGLFADALNGIWELKEFYSQHDASALVPFGIGSAVIITMLLTMLLGIYFGGYAFTGFEPGNYRRD